MMRNHFIGLEILFVIILGFFSQIAAQSAMKQFIENKDSLTAQEPQLADQQGSKVRYIIQSGDTPRDVSIKTGLSLIQLARWNGAINEWVVGDTLYTQRPSEVANELQETVNLLSQDSLNEIIDSEIPERNPEEDIALNEPEEQLAEDSAGLAETIDTSFDEIGDTLSEEDNEEALVGYRLFISLLAEKTLGEERNKVFPIVTTEISPELRAKGFVFFLTIQGKQSQSFLDYYDNLGLAIVGLGIGYESMNLWRFDVAPMLETSLNGGKQVRNILARSRIFVHRGIFDAKVALTLDFDRSGYYFRPQATFSLMQTENIDLAIGGRYSYTSWGSFSNDPKSPKISSFYQHTEFIARFNYTVFGLTAGIGGGTKEIGVTGFANLSIAVPQKEFIYWHK